MMASITAKHDAGCIGMRASKPAHTSASLEQHIQLSGTAVCSTIASPLVDSFTHRVQLLYVDALAHL